MFQDHKEQITKIIYDLIHVSEKPEIQLQEISTKIYEIIQQFVSRIDNSSSLNDKKKIIGFSGTMGSGKTTSQKLAKKYFMNQNVRVYLCNYADNLKRLCSELFPNHPKSSFYGNQEEKTRLFDNLSGRKIMQIIGTEIIRDYADVNFWVNCLQEEINKSDADIILVGDVRFTNEYQFIKNQGGITVKIISNQSSINEHASESIDFECDYTVYNDFCDIRNLETELVQIFYQNL